MREKGTKKPKSLRIRILWLIITSPLIAANNVIFSLLQQHVWDALPMEQSEVVSWGIILFIYLFLLWGIGSLNTIHQVYFAKEKACYLKKQVYSRYIRSKEFLYERKSLGSTINHDIPMLEESYYYAIVHCLICGLDVLFAFIIVFSVHILYGLFCFIIMFIPILLSIRQADQISEVRQNTLEEKEKYTKFLSEMKRGKETIRNYQLLEIVFKQHKEFAAKIAVFLAKIREKMAANMISSQNINRLASAVVAFGGFYLVGQGKLTLGWIVAFLQLSSSMTYSLVDTIQTGVNIFSCRKVYKKVLDQYKISEKHVASEQEEAESYRQKKRILQEESARLEKAETRRLQGESARLEKAETRKLQGESARLEKVETGDRMGCHCHIKSCKLGERQILEEIDFSIAPGDKLLITGKNGSGKTTLLKILLGLNEKYEGVVEWSDERKGLIKKEDVAERIAYIPQSPFVFDASVKDNILLDGMEEELAYQEIKKKVCLKVEDDKILSSLQQNISGGEKQKIELARALSSKRGVLILDEPYSALDQGSLLETEQYLLSDPTKTVIVVSHVEREETRKLYTNHLVIDNGRQEKYLTVV